MDMDYELAKKLQEAGFWDYMGGPAMNAHSPQSADGILYPTLNELIRACGDEITSLEHLPPQVSNPKIRWCAEYQKNGQIQFCEDAESPEEAVANLWLALKNR